MKNLHSKKITKQIIVIIAIIMLCSFTMPSFSYAISTQEGGSELEKISQFICFIPDVVNNVLQNMFITPNKIERNDQYIIYYSPGVIFSGGVPGLSVNFFDPMEDKRAVAYEDYEVIDSNLITAVSVSDCNKETFIKTYAHEAAEIIARTQCEYMKQGDNSGKSNLNDTEDIYTQIVNYTTQHIDTSQLNDNGIASGYFTYNHRCNQEEILIKIIYTGKDVSGNNCSDWKVLYSNGTMNMIDVLDFVAYLKNLEDQDTNFETRYNFTDEFLEEGYNASTIINLGQYNGKTVGLGVVGFTADGAEIRGGSQYFTITGGLQTITGFTYNELVSEQNLDLFIKGLYDDSNDEDGYSIINKHNLYSKIVYDLQNHGMSGIEQQDENYKIEITDKKNPILINGDVFTLYYKSAGNNTHVSFMYSYRGKDVVIDTFVAQAPGNVTNQQLVDKTASAINKLLMSNTNVEDEDAEQIKIKLVNSINSIFQDIAKEKGEKIYTSTSRILQPIVSTWYKALRRIALVGILSVLVYMGIRIVLTSTSASNKAKYKKMFKDWFVALCLLFVLHYIMVFTITIIEQINSVIGSSVMGENGEDVLMTSLRNKILESSSWSVAIAQVVVYMVVTIYTIIFTIQYIRRLVYLAFLTMIAPLITLTYPIDKIKDSKAQAFDTWIKDYIFFNLIQVVHLLLYYIFVSSSINMAKEGNWLYSIVCIGFLTQAEKIMKKMFGFNKSKSIGALGAAATGAIVTNVLNKVKTTSKAPAGGKGGTSNENDSARGSSKPVRTTGNDPLLGMEALVDKRILEGETQDSIDKENRSLIMKDGVDNKIFASQIEDGQEQGESVQGELPSPRTTEDGTDNNLNERNKAIQKANRRIRRLNGFTAVTKKYTGPAIRTVVGAAGGIIGGTIGFAAGVAQGDLGKAIGGAAGGFTAGTLTGQKAVNGAGKVVNAAVNIDKPFIDIADIFREGAYGEEYVEQIRTERANSTFKRSNEYRILKEEYRKLNTNLSEEQLEDELEKNVDKILEAGITDNKRMIKILRMNKKHPLRFSIDKAIRYSKLAEKCPEDILNNTQKFIRFFEDMNIELTQEEIEVLRSNIIEFR